MPVTAKLSKELYDRLGHTVVDELVTWFNQMDATYRNELRDLNDLNFARLEAKLARLEGGLLARIGAAEGRLARLTMTLWVATLATLVAILKLS